MTKVGFICEGKTEKMIVGSADFQKFLKGVGIDCIADIIDAGGNGNLLPKYLPAFTKRLIAKGAEKIVILTDLDSNVCITLTRQRINAPEDHIVIVAVKQVESWFLADSECMSALCKTKVHFPEPEIPISPFEEIRNLLLKHTGRGSSDKLLLAASCLRNNFSIAKAAQHPNSNSAKYFLDKLATFHVEH
jgi:hypothetical protein